MGHVRCTFRQGEYLLGPVRKLIEEGRYSKYSAKQTKLCVAELGNDAGIVGAAMMGKSCIDDGKNGK